MTDRLDAAHAYGRLGWRVTPLHHVNSRGTCSCRLGVNCHTPGKHPVETDWTATASSSGADIQEWWETRPKANIGIATGAASGLWVLDVDPDKGGFNTLHSLIAEHGPLPATRLHSTGSGGVHYLFAWPDFEVFNSSSYLGPGIDTRGTGGQVVAPPSASNKGEYRVLADVELLQAPDWLLERMREHSEQHHQGVDIDVKAAAPVDVEKIPLDIRQLLSQVVEEDAGRYKHFYAIVGACRRAGYEQGQVVTLVTPWCNAVGKYVGRVAAEVARAWGKQHAEAQREQDYLSSLNNGSSALATLKLPKPSPALSIVPEPREGGDGALSLPEPERTSWWARPVREAAASAAEQPEPEFLTRLDGKRLFYRSRVNGLLGESESGKTWVALLAVAQALQGGDTVLYLDFEDTASGIDERLRLMGVSDLDALRCHYMSPEEAITTATATDLRQTLEQREPDLIVLDGVNAAMTLLGFDLENNKDATAFAQQLLRPLAATGAAVVYVDHVPKNKDNRGKGGIGAQAKRAMTTGCALAVEVVQPFGRGMKGRLRLTVDKDRSGRARAACPDAKSAGYAHIDSDVLTGRVTVRIEGVTGGVKVFELMEQISGVLEAGAVDKPSAEKLAKHLGRRGEDVRDALATLLGRDYVTKVGSGSAQHYRSLKPYSMADELTPSAPSHLVPDEVVEDGSPPRPNPVPIRDGVTGSRQRRTDGLIVDTTTGEVISTQDVQP